MASFERYKNESNGVTSNPLKYKTVGVKIDGNHTDIVIIDYSDRLFIILTQYKKLGSFITVYKETARTNSGQGEVYQVRTIQGQEDPDWELASRYLTEQTQMKKPVLYAICMKDSSLRTLKALREILLKNKMW